MDFASCLIVLSGVCLASPQNIQVEAGVSEQVSGRNHYFVNGRDYGGGHLGRFAIVLDQPVTQGVKYRLYFEHRSLLDTWADSGDNRMGLDFVWKPFR